MNLANLSPIFHVGSRQWMLGRIEDHTAKPLSKEDIEAVLIQSKKTEEFVKKFHNYFTSDTKDDGPDITLELVEEAANILGRPFP